MKNSDQPIHPCIMQQIGENDFRLSKDKDEKAYNIPVSGLTKREHFTVLIFASRIQGSFNHPTDHTMYELSTKDADELLKQLEKNK